MATSVEPTESITFGPFRLIPAQRLLEKAGVAVHLSDRAFNLLVILTAKAPEVVPKAVLLAEAWPDVTVEEANLRLQMNALRRALGEDGDENRYIATFHGRGYSFVAPLVRLKAAAASVPAATPGKTNLPRSSGALIGRLDELADIGGRLRRHRQITLIGPGGIGKTRLALEIGRRAAAEFPGGVWLVDLAPVNDCAVVSSAVASVLGVRLRDRETTDDAIAAGIPAERTLLIFDNCEHLVVHAARLIAALLERAASLSVLATSQALLRLPAEQVYRVSPLSLPPVGATCIAEFDAVAFLADRAAMLDPGFVLNDANAQEVGEVCRGLDGIPLALELAASRLPLLGIRGLRDGLREQLAMLKANARVTDGRHATVRAMVEWSHGLLDETEQLLFRRLGIFHGSFSLEAALNVASEIERWEAVDALGRLHDKSLLIVEGGEPPRYRLLETLRLYAVEQMGREGDGERVAERHARFFAELFQHNYETHSDISDRFGWSTVFVPEVDNVRSALDWALGRPRQKHLAIALAPFAAQLLHRLNLYVEARQYLDRAEAVLDEGTPPALAAQLMRDIARVWNNLDNARAMAASERAVALYRQADEPLELMRTLYLLGAGYTFLGRMVEAKTVLLEARDMLEAHGDDDNLVGVYINLGITTAATNEFAEARACFTRATAVARALRNNNAVFVALINLAEVEFATGAVDAAVDCGWQAITVVRMQLRNQDHLAASLRSQAVYLIAQDNAPRARMLVLEALPLHRGNQAGNGVNFLVQVAALLAAIQGQCRAAALLDGFCGAAMAKKGEIVSPSQQYCADRIDERLHAGLSDAEIETYKTQGERWAEADALDFIGHELAAEPMPREVVP